MLPYQEDRELERLLASLFTDDDESTLEDFAVLNWPIVPIIPFTNCCRYSYSSYGG